MPDAACTFLPWVRQGAIATVETADAPNIGSRVTMGVTVRLTDDAKDDVTINQVRLYGPGDVTGFDARQVIRTEPQHLATDFETNYFPVIEFDRPDFPWLFSPAAANANGQLRPWICLIVVPRGEDNLKRPLPDQPLPVLHVAAAAADLPDLSEAWAWAHTQVSLEAGETVDAVLASKPERNLSRLMCPRHLEPRTTYLACVVPTFKAGVLAGLGSYQEAEDEVTLRPAWEAGDTGIQLPVYYHWEFSTGAGGDFEALVWRLERRALPPRGGHPSCPH